MNKFAIALAAALAAGAAAPAAFAQAPNSDPSRFWSQPNRSYVRTYVQTRTVPSIAYDGQVTIGTQVPPSVVLYGIEGDPFYRDYRYSRLNERYVVVDQNGRIVDVVE